MGNSNNKTSNSDTNELHKSREFREEGNKFIEQVINDGLPPVLQRGRLEKALGYYIQALDASLDNKDKSMALKNIALTCIKLYTIILQVRESIETAEHYLKTGIKNYDLALTIGESGAQAKKWCNDLNERYTESIDLLLEHFASKETKDRCHALEEIARELNRKQVKNRIFRETARALFNRSVVDLENGDFKSCLSLLKDCHRPLEEAKLCQTDQTPGIARRILFFLYSSSINNAMDEILELEASVFLQECRAESIQARNAGDALLNTALTESEDLNMDNVYTALDLYKKAILLTNEIEVEMEAIALSRLGVLYDKILKDETRAKQNFMRTLQLAGSLQPRNFHHEDWYKVAATAVERYQQDFATTEAEEYERRRAPYIVEIKDELKKLEEEEEKGVIPLLKYIYKTYPPKNKNYRLGELTDDHDVKKRALRTANLHYHPDRQNKEEHGMKWFVLAEEITKVINRNYEVSKGERPLD